WRPGAPAPREVLEQFACLGNTTRTAALSIVQGRSEEGIDAALSDVVNAGLVSRVDGGYRFAHDRVQEAAYALISEPDRAAAHLKIGRVLVSRTAPADLDEKIFEIVNQFNRAASLIQSVEEREQVAKLNLAAGKRAKASTAYASALTYFVAGRTLLPSDGLESRYELTFALEFQQAECEFLTGAQASAEERLSVLSRYAATLVDKGAVAWLRVTLYTALGSMDRAIE